MSATKMRGWCVVWRTGNSEIFKWHRSEEMTREAADGSCSAFGRDGVCAMVVNYRQSVAIGLPTTWGEGASCHQFFF